MLLARDGLLPYPEDAPARLPLARRPNTLQASWWMLNGVPLGPFPPHVPSEGHRLAGSGLSSVAPSFRVAGDSVLAPASLPRGASKTGHSTRCAAAPVSAHHGRTVRGACDVVVEDLPGYGYAVATEDCLSAAPDRQIVRRHATQFRDRRGSWRFKIGGVVTIIAGRVG